MIKNANQYFKEQLDKIGPQLKIFKAAKLFSPLFISSRPCNPDDVNELTCISTFNDTKIIQNLEEEFPKYYTIASQCPLNIDLLNWWPQAAAEIPHWAEACQ